MDSTRFQVNFTGILKLLSDNLYSQREIFLRELLQNAVDAIAARKLIEDFTPAIKIEYYSTDAGSGIIVNDNGIGLTQTEVEEFLSKIGASSKSAEEVSLRRKEFIGQFGIGLLSCFMVSDEITVITKSAKEDQTIRWVGNINGSYRTEVSPNQMQTGTRVVLALRKDADFSDKKLINFATQYGEYLGIPIEMEIDGETTTLGRDFPWETPHAGEDLLQWGKRIFNENFLSHITLNDAEGQTRGAAFIIPHPTQHGALQNNRVYIKKMFVNGKAHNLLPDWAFFVRAVVNSNSLSPTASREDIYHNKVSDAVKEELGNCIKQYFRELGQTNPAKLQQIINIHANALKSIALSDHSFLQFIYPWFTLPTTEGDLSLKAIKARTHSILYMTDLDEFRQVLPIATAGNTLIVNAGYIYDADLLAAISTIDAGNLYNRIGVAYFGNILNDVSLDEYDTCETRIRVFQKHLAKFRCELFIKKFEPAAIPAIFHLDLAKQIEKDIDSIREDSNSLWASISSGLFQPDHGYRSKLFLNYNNPIVSKLLKNTDSKLDQPFIEILYTQAMSLGHYPLSHDEMTIMNKNLIFIMDNIL